MPAAKRGRGRPKGSKNRKTLEREAAARAKAAGCEAGPSIARAGVVNVVTAQGLPTRSRVIMGSAADVVSLDTAPREPCASEEGEGSRPLLGARGVTALALVVKAPARRLTRAGPANAPPVHEFFIVITGALLERLKLPESFARIYARFDPDHVTLREPSPRQAPWNVKTVRDAGGLFLEDGWKEFVHHYGIGWAYSLTFRYQEKSSEIFVKVFGPGMDRASFATSVV